MSDKVELNKLQTGVCRFCGQARMVEAVTKEGADRIVTSECTCSEAAAERRKDEAMNKLLQRMSFPEEATGFKPLSDEGQSVIEELANSILENVISSAQIDIEGRTVKLKRTQEAFSFLQTKKIEDSEEC